MILIITRMKVLSAKRLELSQLSDNPKLEAEGAGEKIAGKVQEKIGQFKKVLGT